VWRGGDVHALVLRLPCLKRLVSGHYTTPETMDGNKSNPRCQTTKASGIMDVRGHPNGRKDDGPGESVIRLMTRLSAQHGAINLSQGFPNESPPLAVRIALARGVLTGLADSEGAYEPRGQGEEESAETHSDSVEDAVRSVLRSEPSWRDKGEDGEATIDILNQYSPPMGRPDLRQALSDHYERMYSYHVDPECITVTLGATEAVASALRTVGRPGDRIAVFEPFHELYPSQCRIFWMQPDYVTLREKEGIRGGAWTFDPDELEDVISGRRSGGQIAKALLLNSPHNPTGKVFSLDELRLIVDTCEKYGTYIITDEIYEHMTYGPHRGGHVILPKAFPYIADRTFICNSMGKSASATGWRLGWCLHPPQFTSLYRGIHDQMVVMSPHPMQYAALTYLRLPESYFRETLAERYLGRVRTLANALKKVGFGVSEPEGAYYLFVRYNDVPKLSGMKPWDAAMYMVKEVGVACVPGDNFYGSEQALKREGSEYLRFAACRSWEDVKGACDRIERAIFKD